LRNRCAILKSFDRRTATLNVATNRTFSVKRVPSAEN
jgi:hypothetical protein